VVVGAVVVGSVVDGGAVVSVGVAGSVVVLTPLGVVGAGVDIVGDVGVCLVPPVPFVWSAK
jgi:hypothetical protein